MRAVGTRRTGRASLGDLRDAGLMATVVATGILAGFLLWSGQQTRHQRSLFHASPRRRLAALGYLRAHPSVDSARLLRDYLRWEPLPLLRRRARGVLRRTERLLRS
jgi:hypothetical protein